MAHQWFGDLVTMQWWDNIWLNEGFATWMENKPVAAMHPEWNIDQLVAADEDGHAEPRRAAHHPRHPRQGRYTRRDQPDVRRHRLRQGQRRAAHG
jgi:aminopeptidase N